MNYLNKIRIENPLTICYTNDVVKNFTANGLLSIGASPAMSEAPEEAEEFYKVAQGLLINIGTLTAENEQDIIAIAQTANEAGLPIVFDPVAVGASTYRKQFCKLLLKSAKVSVIKGNASEILALIDDTATMKGTDSDANLDAVTIAKKAYATYKTAIVITGKEDVIVQDNKAIVLAKELQHLCHQYDVPFIVNDDVSLAKEINADGIHVGQDDAKVKEIAQYFTDKIIGLSISDLDEYAKSDLTHVDYIGVGPIYPTPSKHDAHIPVGPEMIATFKEMNPQLPIVAIGGINTNNVAPIVEAGANGISVISAISKSENIENTVNRFKDFFNN
ncbi:TPA: hydroxyethylthiazole kinase [Staphylococcus aureus]